MKKFILLFKFFLFSGLALFLVLYGPIYFELSDSWRYILIAGLLLLAGMRLYDWWALEREGEQFRDDR
ncbi:MAG: hypothetical protein EA409_02070 [Saprospirales bacterium]|nr:MAG: hypothetical protein EA409_02070 [Saprospirales bacterium]